MGAEIMEILHAISPAFALSGFLVGLLVGLTGVGGGSLMTPLLVLVFDVQTTTAVGTDLLYAERPRLPVPSCTIDGGQSIGE